MDLFYREYGEGKPLLIVHGLFGSSDNWVTIGRRLSNSRKVLLIDQRNHGHSPHSSEFQLSILGDDIGEFVRARNLGQVDIIGHSLGGKAAMAFGMNHAPQLDKLIVVDIAPKPYQVHHDDLIDAMLSLDLKELNGRKEADQILQQHISNDGVRQFLLKNLAKREDGSFFWRLNLPILKKNLDLISGPLEDHKAVQNPTLFLKGTKSNYITLPGDQKVIKELFPNSEIKELEAGHWLHSERPVEFVEIVEEFLS